MKCIVSKMSLLVPLQLLVVCLCVGGTRPDETIEDGLLSLNSGRISYSDFMMAPFFSSAKLISIIEREPESVLAESGITVLALVKERAAVNLLFKLMLHNDQIVSSLACNALRLCAEGLRPVVDEERELILMISDRCEQLIEFYVDGHADYHPRVLQAATVTLLTLRYSENESDVVESVPKTIGKLFESGLLPFRTYEVLMSRMRTMDRAWIQEIFVAEMERARRMFGPQVSESPTMKRVIKGQTVLNASESQSEMRL